MTSFPVVYIDEDTIDESEALALQLQQEEYDNYAMRIEMHEFPREPLSENIAMPKLRHSELDPLLVQRVDDNYDSSIMKLLISAVQSATDLSFSEYRLCTPHMCFFQTQRKRQLIKTTHSTGSNNPDGDKQLADSIKSSIEKSIEPPNSRHKFQRHPLDADTTSPCTDEICILHSSSSGDTQDVSMDSNATVGTSSLIEIARIQAEDHGDDGDAGWGCGLRNAQMVISSLLCHSLWKNKFESRLFGGAGFVPRLYDMQLWMERAWQAGFDQPGMIHFGGELAGTHKWVGTAEVAALLRSFGVRANVHSFQALKAGKRLPRGRARRPNYQVNGENHHTNDNQTNDEVTCISPPVATLSVQSKLDTWGSCQNPPAEPIHTHTRTTHTHTRTTHTHTHKNKHLIVNGQQ
eukprot:GHVR01094334.1.p1 GENE.GHVR01094334.1~~GHVR01094334.1.p1  ORF type:complete len:406 (-),score=89.84 GHVR01094334.1:407-1624(-)